MGVHQTVIHRYRPGMTGLKKCLVAVGLSIWAPVSLSAYPEQTVLVYVHSPTCGACAQFDREVGAIYHKTEESALLPLQRISLEAWQDGQHDHSDCVAMPVSSTPTFVQIQDCQEIDRVTGYSDEALFWLALRRMVNRLAPASRNKDPAL
jgi:thioredoxin-like negative regulator of GroEL